jgi:hypothetical protein
MQPDMLSQLVADRKRELAAGRSRRTRPLPPRRERASGPIPARRGRALALLRALYAR